MGLGRGRQQIGIVAGGMQTLGQKTSQLPVILDDK